VTPAGHSPGDTHSSRTGFNELNKLIEMARGWLPENNFVNEPITSRMNIPSACNAFYSGLDGTINFYRSGPFGTNICRNTGEIAAVFDHEWGHAMDDHDGGPFSAPFVCGNPASGVVSFRANHLAHVERLTAQVMAIAVSIAAAFGISITRIMPVVCHTIWIGSKRPVNLRRLTINLDLAAVKSTAKGWSPPKSVGTWSIDIFNLPSMSKRLMR
jgi:hypothetical protein